MSRLLRPRVVVPLLLAALALTAALYFDPLDLFVPRHSGVVTNTGDLIKGLRHHEVLGPLRLTFTPAGGGRARVAEVNPDDLTFAVKLPPGKYRVRLSIDTVKDPPEAPDAVASINRARLVGEAEEMTVLLSAYPLGYEVTRGAGRPITLDFSEWVRDAQLSKGR